MVSKLYRRYNISSPGAAAATGVGTSTFGSRAVLDQSDLSTVNLCAIKLLQSPLHIRVEPELNHSLILPAFVGVGIGHLPCLPHVVLLRTIEKQGRWLFITS